MSAATEASEYVGLKAVDQEGDSVGEVENAFGDIANGWLMLKTGMLGRKSYMVPSAGADPSGGELRLPWTKDHIKDGPEVPGDGALSQELRDAIDAHFSGGPTGSTAATDTVTENVDGTERPPVESTDDAPVTYGEDSEIRDPNRGTRRESSEMILPEHHKGLRPMPGEEDRQD